MDAQDSLFLLKKEDRTNFLQQILHSCGCTYICLWSYNSHPSNCLQLLDGIYNERISETISSESSYRNLARTLFEQYKQSIVFILDKNSQVPGLAFKNRLPYIHLNTIDLERLVSEQAQGQFYQEARIKSVIFMGCKSGEIEIGLSTDTRVKLEREMMTLFGRNISRENLARHNSQLVDKNQTSSSSSTLRPVLTDSSLNCTAFKLIDNSNSSPFQFNTPNKQSARKNLLDQQALRPKVSQSKASTTNNDPFQQALIPIIQNPKFPTLESVDAIMTRAFLAVITSSSSGQKNVGAFKSYTSSTLVSAKSQTNANNNTHNILRRSINFFSRLNFKQKNKEQIQAKHQSTSINFHHARSERRRRESLNERFQALATLLPPDFCKKSKTSVLSSATNYLGSLKAQVEELRRINHMLKACNRTEIECSDREMSSGSSWNPRPEVKVVRCREESMMEDCVVVELKVNVIRRGAHTSMLDLIGKILEFVKQFESLILLSIQANLEEASCVYRVTLRLKIEGCQWDESAFQEALKRIVDDKEL